MEKEISVLIGRFKAVISDLNVASSAPNMAPWQTKGILEMLGNVQQGVSRLILLSAIAGSLSGQNANLVKDALPKYASYITAAELDAQMIKLLVDMAKEVDMSNMPEPPQDDNFAKFKKALEA